MNIRPDPRVRTLLQPQLTNNLFNNSPALLARRRRRQPEIRRIAQRLPHRQGGDQHVLLHDVRAADAAQIRIAIEGRRAGNRGAGNAHPAGHEVQQRRLAGPAAADDGREAAAGHGGVDAGQHGLGWAGVLPAESVP